MKSEAKRLHKSILEKDIYAFRALKGITGYSPVHPELQLSNLSAKYDMMESHHDTETVKESEYKAAYDDSVEAEHVFHNLILEVKNQIRAQFGSSSNELQSLGLKKKSEYKSPAKSKK